MGILSAFRTAPKEPEQRQYSPTWLQQFNMAFALANEGGSAGTKTTILGEQEALTVSAIWSANKLLSEIPASLDVQHRVKDGDYFENVTDSSLARTLRKPNHFQSSYTFFQSMFMRMNLRGNSYAFIETSPRGDKILHPVIDDVMVSESPDGTEIYYSINGKPFPSTEILHFRNLSIDGIMGLSPIYYAARTIHNAIDAERFMSKVYESGIMTTGFFTTAERLTEKSYARLKDDIKDKSGIERAGEAQILEQGLKFERNQLSAVDSAVIEQMNFSVEEVCRIYRIPKHLLYLDAKGGSTQSFGTQAREFLTFTLSPMLNNVEEELGQKLLTDEEYRSGDVKIRFDTKALLRVDPKERADYYKTMFNIGSMTPNEIRAEEGRKPIEGGDTAFVQLNLAPIEQLEEIIADKINQQVNSNN
jgi:HK97 family phage portal protein